MADYGVYERVLSGSTYDPRFHASEDTNAVRVRTAVAEVARVLDVVSERQSGSSPEMVSARALVQKVADAVREVFSSVPSEKAADGSAPRSP